MTPQRGLQLLHHFTDNQPTFSGYIKNTGDMGNICLVSRHYSQSHHIHIIYPVLLPFDEDVEVPKTKRELYRNHLLDLHTGINL